MSDSLVLGLTLGLVAGLALGVAFGKGDFVKASRPRACPAEQIVSCETSCKWRER